MRCKLLECQGYEKRWTRNVQVVTQRLSSSRWHLLIEMGTQFFRLLLHFFTFSPAGLRGLLKNAEIHFLPVYFPAGDTWTPIMYPLRKDQEQTLLNCHLLRNRLAQGSLYVYSSIINAQFPHSFQVPDFLPGFSFQLPTIANKKSFFTSVPKDPNSFDFLPTDCADCDRETTNMSTIPQLFPHYDRLNLGLCRKGWKLKDGQF